VLPRLNDEGRGTTSLKIGRPSRGLVVGEMALSFALVVVSGLVLRSIVNVTSFDPGFATREVLTARVNLPAAEYPDGPSRTLLVITEEAEIRHYPDFLVRATLLGRLKTVLPHPWQNCGCLPE
jgi:hypothetical protein